MFNYDDQLRRFHDDKIRLPGHMKDVLLGHRGANEDRIIARIPDYHARVRIGKSSFRSQGSFAVGLIVQTRFAEEEYDIDDGIVVEREQLKNDDGSEMTADEVKELFRKVLKDARFKRQPNIHTNCVRVYYADEDEYRHHVDFPIYREFAGASNDTIRELASDGTWVGSNPTRVNVWFSEEVERRNQATAGSGRQMRRLIRYLKRFCRSRRDWDMPNGMKLTMLVVELYRYYAREDEAFHRLLVALQSRLAWSLEIENLASESYPRPKLTRTSADQNVVNLRDRVGDALQELAVLFRSDCTSADARRAWDWVFKSDGYFAELEEKAKAEAKRQELLAASALINSGRAYTTGAGRIAAAGVVANTAHAFYGHTFEEHPERPVRRVPPLHLPEGAD